MSFAVQEFNVCTLQKWILLADVSMKVYSISFLLPLWQNIFAVPTEISSLGKLRILRKYDSILKYNLIRSKNTDNIHGRKIGASWSQLTTATSAYHTLILQNDEDF